MSMSDWAEREIKLAIERERKANGGDPNEWDYGVACYESAYKAFKSLMDDGHSGMSISITKQILNRLIEGKPLTPIEDTDDIWEDIGKVCKECTTYQCKRMSSLFKDIYDDGRIEYSENNRVVFVDVKEDGRETYCYNSFISRFINEMFPITFPYIPEDKPYKVYRKEFLYDPKNGDYDTMWITHVVKPDGERVEINRYFKEEGFSFVEIAREEFDERLNVMLSELRGE